MTPFLPLRGWQVVPTPDTSGSLYVTDAGGVLRARVTGLGRRRTTDRARQVLTVQLPDQLRTYTWRRR